VSLHFMVNFVGELCELAPRAELFYATLWIVAAIIVTSAGGLGDSLVRLERLAS